MNIDRRVDIYKMKGRKEKKEKKNVDHLYSVIAREVKNNIRLPFFLFSSLTPDECQ